MPLQTARGTEDGLASARLHKWTRVTVGAWSLSLVAQLAHAAQPVSAATPTAGEQVGAWLDGALKRSNAACRVGDISVHDATIAVDVACNGSTLGNLQVAPADLAPTAAHVGPIALTASWPTAQTTLAWQPFLAALEPPPPRDALWKLVEPPAPLPVPQRPPPPRFQPPPPDPGQYPWAWLLLGACVLVVATLRDRPTARRWLLRLTLLLVTALVVDTLLGLLMAHTLHTRDLAAWRDARHNFDDVFLPTIPPSHVPADQPPFVIGVLGGSVALQVGESLAAHPEQFAAVAELSAQLHRPVVVRALGIEGSAQPSQFNVLQLFHDQLDAAVFLDGFNELFVARDSPDANCVRLSQLWRENSAPTQQILEPLRRLHADVVSRLEATRWAPSRWSVVGGYAWTTLQANHKTQVNQYYRWPFPSVAHADDVDISPPAREAKWLQCIEQTTLAAQKWQFPVLFFLQPNQYVRGAKPLSEQERTAFTQRQSGDGTADSAVVYRDLNARYGDLQRGLDGLRSKGLPVESLVRLFEQTTETVYSDNCCHFNPRGVEMLGNAILRRVGSVVQGR